MAYEFTGKKPLRIPLPLPQVGLGTLIKRATTALGVKPCGGCQRRAAWLDQRLVLGRRR
jgi:hypothetical protein